MLVGIADDRTYSGQRRDFFWRSLRVASSHNNLRFRILSTNASDRGACILIGRGRHRACVQHNYGCVGRACSALQSLVGELPLQGCAIGLRGAASEVFDVVSGHSSIVAQVLRSFAPRTATSGCPYISRRFGPSIPTSRKYGEKWGIPFRLALLIPRGEHCVQKVGSSFHSFQMRITQASVIIQIHSQELVVALQQKFDRGSIFFC